MGLRESFFETCKAPPHKVVQTAWGDVLVREMTAGDFEEFQRLGTVTAKGDDGKDRKEFRDGPVPRLLAAARDPQTGERVFADADAEHVRARGLTTQMLPVLEAFAELNAMAFGGADAGKESPETAPSA